MIHSWYVDSPPLSRHSKNFALLPFIILVLPPDINSIRSSEGKIIFLWFSYIESHFCLHYRSAWRCLRAVSWQVAIFILLYESALQIRKKTQKSRSAQTILLLTRLAGLKIIYVFDPLLEIVLGVRWTSESHTHATCLPHKTTSFY